MKGHDCVADSLELGGLCFHSDRETQNAGGVPAGGIDVVPEEGGMKKRKFG